MKTSAEKLKMLRELKGMSQADCAKALGIDRTTYVKYENGGSVRRNVEKLARFFQVSTDYLLGNTDDPIRPYSEMAPDEKHMPIQEVVTIRDKYGHLHKDKSVPVYGKDTLDKSIEYARRLVQDDPAPAQPPAPKVTHYTYRIPVVGRVAAGQPILAQEEIIDYEYIDERLHRGGDQYFGLVVKGTSMEPTIHDGDTIIVRVQEEVENGQIAVVLVDGEDATVKEVKESEDGLTLIGHNVAVYTPHFYSREEVERLPVRIIGRVIQSISKF